MGQSDGNSDRVTWLRRFLLWLLVFGLVGTETELLLLEHYEDPWQFVPLVLNALAFLVLLWHAKRDTAASLGALKVLMGLFLIAGFLGLALHLRGAAQFQLELDPTIDKWNLFKKVMVAKAPPVLAPGVMLQLGLTGLAYAFSDSRAKRSETV
jgi:hypothetical protein